MKLRIMSDLHLEFHEMRAIPSRPDDRESILVLAGDVCPYVRSETLLHFLHTARSRFAHVIYVLGNHEFYGGLFPSGYAIVRNMIMDAGFSNVHLLEKNAVNIGGICFAGATLWTDFAGSNVSMKVARRGMSDYQLIRTTPQRFITPRLLRNAHDVTRAWICATLAHAREFSKRTVLVTHHGVAPGSIAPQFANDPLNPAFASDLSEVFLEHEPALVIHGHTHVHRDYVVGKTRVVANPRGYPGESSGFNESLVVSI